MDHRLVILNSILADVKRIEQDKPHPIFWPGVGAAVYFLMWQAGAFGDYGQNELGFYAVVNIVGAASGFMAMMWAYTLGGKMAWITRIYRSIVRYQKMGPVLSDPDALIAVIDATQKQKAVDVDKLRNWVLMEMTACYARTSKELQGESKP